MRTHDSGMPWETITHGFESCKRAFDGEEILNFNAQGKIIPLDPSVPPLSFRLNNNVLPLTAVETLWGHSIRALSRMLPSF